MALYNSMANTINCCTVDCRMIQLEMHMFSLSRAQLTELAVYCASYFHDLFSSEFYQQWNWRNRKTSFETLLKKISCFASHKNHFDFNCCADVLSSAVYDSKSFRAYDEMLFGSNSKYIWDKTLMSADYPEILQKYSADIKNPEKCKETILSLFYEKEKKMLGLWRKHDATVNYIVFPHHECADLYQGLFNFRIAYKCINDAVSFARGLIDFLLHAMHISPNINATIALSPVQSPSNVSPHMLYFGGNVPVNYLENLAKQFGHTLDRYYHIYGAEWFNLVSPFVSARLPKFVADEKNMAVDKLSNGATVVKSTKNIDETDVGDLLNLKKYLYPVLYPGGCKIIVPELDNYKTWSYLTKPRCQWECVPVLPEEITVEKNVIRLSYYHK